MQIGLGERTAATRKPWMPWEWLGSFALARFCRGVELYLEADQESSVRSGV